MNESALVAAYAPVPTDRMDTRQFHLGDLTYRPCACGAWIGADEGAPFAGVRAHVIAQPHSGWSARGGFDALPIYQRRTA